MKRILITVLLCMAMAAQAQWYNGWSAKTGLVLSLHLTDSLPELYSPMQSDVPLPVSQSSRRGDTLRIECSSLNLKITLTPRDGDLVGTWRQGFLREDITFEASDTIFLMRRPQTPQPPYAFDEETVVADYTDSQGNAVHLEGTLTYPRGDGRYPCLVLVSGSGQQNRDEEIFFHKPFLVLADYLASRGIATLRYDDRGVGASTGVLDSADTRLFAEDAEAMFKAVQGNRHVDRKRLGLGGHSEGGAIAPMVAARNRDVKFVVMLAGQGCSGLDVMMQQNEAIYRAAGLGESLLAERLACMRELFAMPQGATLDEYRAVIKRHTAELTPAQVDSIGLGRGAAAQVKQQLDSRWMQTFLKLNPAEWLPKVKCPMLALNGSTDCQVVARPNQARIRELTKHRAECRELPGLNHLFQHSATGTPSDYVKIEETMAPEAMQAVAEWVLSLRK